MEPPLKEQPTPAQIEGYLAYQAGKEQKDNPYPETSHRYYEWRRGHIEAWLDTDPGMKVEE